MNSLVKIIIIVLAALLGIGLLVFNAGLYHSLNQQKLELAALRQDEESKEEIKRAEAYKQSQKIDALEKALAELKKQAQDQEVSIQQMQNDKDNLKDTLSQTASTLTAVKDDALALKKNMNSWQKDYVAALADLNGKNDSFQNDMKIVLKKIESFKIIEMNNQIIHLNATMIALEKKINDMVSQVAPSTEAPKRTHLKLSDFEK